MGVDDTCLRSSVSLGPARTPRASEDDEGHLRHLLEEMVGEGAELLEEMFSGFEVSPPR